MKGISRKGNGYLVRVGFLGQVHARFFGDRAYDGPRRALLAAKRWRNATELELGKPRSDRRVVSVSSRGPGALPGIREITRKGVPVLEVTWMAGGKQRRTTISIIKHGRDAALARALELRAS